MGFTYLLREARQLWRRYWSCWRKLNGGQVYAGSPCPLNLEMISHMILWLLMEWPPWIPRNGLSTGRFNGAKLPTHPLPMFPRWEYSPKSNTQPICIFIAQDMHTQRERKKKGNRTELEIDRWISTYFIVLLLIGSDQICVIKVIVMYKAALHNSSQYIGAVQLFDLLSSGW